MKVQQSLLLFFACMRRNSFINAHVFGTPEEKEYLSQERLLCSLSVRVFLHGMIAVSAYSLLFLVLYVGWKTVISATVTPAVLPEGITCRH